MPDTTTIQKEIAPELTRFNAIVGEYVEAVMSRDPVRHKAAADAMDRLAEESAWNEVILDYVSDFVDAAPLTVAVTDEPSERTDRMTDGPPDCTEARCGLTIYAQHTEHVAYGVHETARDALKAWVIEERANDPR